MKKFFSILGVLVIIGVGYALFVDYQDSQSAKESVQASQAFLDGNKSTAGIITTASGLEYQVLTPGTGTQNPKGNELVTVNYHGTLPDGTVIESSIGQEMGLKMPVTLPIHSFIRGWREGLSLMVKGEKLRLFIPPHLAYGNKGVNNIPAGSALIYDVELVEIGGGAQHSTNDALDGNLHKESPPLVAN